MGRRCGARLWCGGGGGDGEDRLGDLEEDERGGEGVLEEEGQGGGGQH